MTPEVSTAAPETVDPARELLSWRYHPAREGGWRLLVVIATLIFVPAILGLLYGPFFPLIALVLLVGALGTYFLPTDYTLYSGGLETRFLGVARRFNWDQFRSFYPDRNGVLLSPFSAPSRLENFRGLFVRYHRNREQVLSVISAHVPIPGNSA